MSKNDPHFPEFQKHVWYVHHAHTTEMKDVLIEEIGEIWESWGVQQKGKKNKQYGLAPGLRKFWNGNMQGVWSRWALGEFDCSLATPSQQMQAVHESQLINQQLHDELVLHWKLNEPRSSMVDHMVIVCITHIATGVI